MRNLHTYIQFIKESNLDVMELRDKGILISFIIFFIHTWGWKILQLNYLKSKKVTLTNFIIDFSSYNSKKSFQFPSNAIRLEKRAEIFHFPIKRLSQSSLFFIAKAFSYTQNNFSLKVTFFYQDAWHSFFMTLFILLMIYIYI